MDGIELLDLRAVCRACALSFPSTVLRDITPPTRDMLAFCTGLEIELMSEMPTHVCGTCLSRADDASQFKMQCLRSEERLRACAAALRPVHASTPMHTDTAHAGPTPAPHCSDRSVMSDFDLPLSPLGCKVEEMFNEGASNVFEDSNLSNFMKDILDENFYDAKQKNMIIDEIMDVQLAPVADSTSVPNFTAVPDDDSSYGVTKGTTPVKIIKRELNENEKIEKKYYSQELITNRDVTKENNNSKKITRNDFNQELNSHELIANTDRIKSNNKNEKNMQSYSNQEPKSHKLIFNTVGIEANTKIPQECHVKVTDFVKLAMPEHSVLKSLNKLGFIRCRYCFIPFQESQTIYRHLTDQHSLDCMTFHGANFISLAMPEHLLVTEFMEHKFVRCRFCDCTMQDVKEVYLHLQKIHYLECQHHYNEIDYVRRAMPELSNSEELHKLGFVRCRFCYQTFKEILKLYQHLRNEHALECKQCEDGYDYIKMSMPEIELMEYLKKGFIKCRYCHRKSFKSVERVYRHLKCMHDRGCRNTWFPGARDAYYTCDQCGKTSTRKIYIIKHLATHERSPISAALYCEVCNRTFKSVPSHRGHMRMHELKLSNVVHQVKTETRSAYTCETCGKCYSTKSNLNAHARSHAPEQRLPCAQCDRVFQQLGSLARHVKIHREKSYKCNECPKMFVRSDHLAKHCRVHTGERPYKCVKCGMQFTQSNALRLHKRRKCLAIDHCEKKENTGASESTSQCDEIENVSKIEMAFQNDERRNISIKGLPLQMNEPVNSTNEMSYQNYYETKIEL